VIKAENMEAIFNNIIENFGFIYTSCHFFFPSGIYIFRKIIQLTSSNIKSFSVKTESRVWHELLTIGFVKVTSGYVEKAWCFLSRLI
jgi:hypothetical protein